MPSETRAPNDVIETVKQLAARYGFESESLRKMIWRSYPPPLFKRLDKRSGRERWYGRVSEMDAWYAERNEPPA